MYHDLVLPALPLLTAIAVLIRVWCVRRIVEGLFAGFEQAGNANAEGTALRPAAVSEWRVVWSGRGKMPIRIGRVKSSAVPSCRISICTMAPPAASKNGVTQCDLPRDDHHIWLPTHCRGLIRPYDRCSMFESAEA